MVVVTALAVVAGGSDVVDSVGTELVVAGAALVAGAAVVAVGADVAAVLPASLSLEHAASVTRPTAAAMRNVCFIVNPA